MSAFFGGVLAIGLAFPSLAGAQPGQLQEIRASAFILVASDGTELARLAPGNSGNGTLTLNNPTGTRRVSLQGIGTLAVWGEDGLTPLFRAGLNPGSGIGGWLNGVELGPGGAITVASPIP
jgi:hypothetical protein